MRTGVLFLWMCLALAGTGCRAAQIAYDQDRMRRALIDLYTNQLMDNLIRAKNGYPMLQMEYSDITGQITQDANGTIGDDKTSTSEATLSTLKHTFETTFKWSAGAKQSNQLAITGNPVVDHNEVYDAYLQFVTTPGWFIASYNPPPPCAAHIVREKDGVFYWVPREHAAEFLRLSLVTTVQRGQPLHVPQQYETTIVDVLHVRSAIVQSRPPGSEAPEAPPADLELPDPEFRQASAQPSTVWGRFISQESPTENATGAAHIMLLKLNDAIPNDNGEMTVLTNRKNYTVRVSLFNPSELLMQLNNDQQDKLIRFVGEKQLKEFLGPNDRVKYLSPEYSNDDSTTNDGSAANDVSAGRLFGKPTKFLVLMYTEDDNSGGDEGVTAYIKLSPESVAEAFKGSLAKIRLDYHRPAIPTTDAMLNSIRNEARLIRLNQFTRPF